MFRSLLISGMLAAAAIGPATTANADELVELDYVRALDGAGVHYTNILDVIDVGKAACYTIRNAQTVASVNTTVDTIERLGYSDYEAGTIVGAAATNMCPDIWPTLDAWGVSRGYNPYAG